MVVMKILLLLFAVCRLSVGLVPGERAVRSPLSLAVGTPHRRNFWLKMATDPEAPDAAAAFESLKPHLPQDLDIAQAGGYDTLKRLSDDPKKHLLEMVKASQQEESDATSNIDNLDAVTALLYAQGKGFESDLVDGEWVLVLQRQGSKSPKFQKLVGKGERRIGKSYSTFDVTKRQFNGEVRLLKGLLTVSSTVQYTPVSDNFDVYNDGKIVLRRIACDIVKAGIKLKLLPRLGLPFLRKKGGSLDFVYLDRDLRVTKGNRGGLFVHARPAVARELSSASSSSSSASS